jgi:hypothetical protein
MTESIDNVLPNSTAPVAAPRTNRLAGEKSPYLLQHQHNPVDWQPWGEAAFLQARRERKPIFLSIGYATCHWCHVMERESFEDRSIAALLNAGFVSIKVDREERPDVDRIYMAFVQATTGQGGWPLNVFLTPDLVPFFGGTYFPPDNRGGRPGFGQVLEHVQQAWLTRHDAVIESAAQIRHHLEEMAASLPPSHLLLTTDTIRQAGTRFKQTYDPRDGGFGGAPKFPQPVLPQFLLRYAQRFHDDEARRMVLHTCERVAAGGIRDHLGGGFARYATDAHWLVPHFEKMLYDNAQLAQLYLDAALLSGEVAAGPGHPAQGPDGRRPRRPGDGGEDAFAPVGALHAEVARDILAYIHRDMTHPEGGFYSAEDADSEGHEGKFYCWTRAELAELLAPNELDIAVRYFGVTDEGNFTDHSHPQPLPNLNVLSVVEPDLTGPERALLAAAKRKLAAARARRVRPPLDDKILASWNGLMLGAFARASVVLDDPALRAVAEKNLAFVQARLWDADTRTLYHRWRDGERDSVQLLSAYAFLLSGVLELYEATLAPAHLDFAIALADALLARFYDPDAGGFWQTTAAANDLIVRLKDDYDGAEPSGNSVAALALLRLGKITGRGDFTAAAEKTLRGFASRLQQSPEALPGLLAALDFWLSEPPRFVLAADPGAASTPAYRALLRAIHSVYRPNKVVLGNAGAVEPFARTLPARDGPVVYVCIGTACLPPTSDPDRVRAALEQ